MEDILQYYQTAFDNKDPSVPYIESSNDLFGFNCSEIPLDKYERLFQKYQIQKGKSRNIIEAFDTWILDRLPNLIENQKIEDPEKETFTYFENVRIHRPYMVSTTDVKYDGLPDKDNIVPMYPRDALLTQDTYSSEIKVDIYSRKKTSPGSDSNTFERKLERANVTIGKVPIIKGSHYCWLRDMTDQEKAAAGECFNDPFGYFIIGGAEKFVVAKENLRSGTMIVAKFNPKTPMFESILMYTPITSSSIKIQLDIDHKNDNAIDVKLHEINHLPVFILSLLLHFLNDDSLVDNSKTYESMMATCRTVLQKIVEPEIMQFVLPKEVSRIRSRLLSTITKTMSIIESDIVSFIDENQSDDPGEIIIDPIDILSKQFGKTGGTSKFSPNTRSLIEEIKINVFPTTADDTLDSSSVSNDYNRRSVMLSKLISTYTRTLEGFRPVDDRDSYMVKRIDTVGRLMEKEFNKNFKNILREFKTNSLTLYDDKFTRNFEKGIRSGNKIGGKRENFSEALARPTPAAIYSMIQRVTIRSNENSHVESVRTIHPTQNGYICSGETPEGEKCGIVKNLTTLCWVSIARNADIVEDIVSDFIVEYKETPNHIPVLVNGDVRGWTTSEQYIPLKERIKTNIDTFDVTVALNSIDNHIDISSLGSLPTRPLLKVNPDTGILMVNEIPEEDLKSMSIDELITSGFIEFNSPLELDSRYSSGFTETEAPLWSELNKGFRYIKIAEYTNDVNSLLENHTNDKFLDEQPFTHSELIPHVQFGYSASCIPKGNHNKGARVTYQSSMLKQALSGFNSVHNERFDSGYKLHQFPTRSMFETSTQKPIGINAMPTTASPVIAMYVRAMNNEDAIVAKREFLDNNLRFVSYMTNVISIRDNEIINVNPEQENDPKLHALYKHSDNVSPELVGFPKLGSFVNRDDVILGKYTKSINNNTGEIIHSPNHCSIALSKEGYIVAIEVIRSSHASKVVRIKVAQFRRQVVGDKIASRYSQKGTFGEIVPEKDLPRIVGGDNDGVVPDIWFNPHGIPSRLTQGKMLEILASKASLYTGMRINASSFSNYEDEDYMKVFEKILSDNGMEPSGLEVFRHPDGTLFEAKIYVGICSYQILKHHVSDKIQVRDTGRMDKKTMQPVRGRFFEGGIRIGEMERDAMISHGTSSVVMDRLMESSDLYRVIVCKKCGNIAQSNFEVLETRCTYCTGDTEFGVVNIPYVSHLIIRMLNAAGIHIHYRF